MISAQSWDFRTLSLTLVHISPNLSVLFICKICRFLNPPPPSLRTSYVNVPKRNDADGMSREETNERTNGGEKGEEGEGNHEFLCVHRRVTGKQRKELFPEAGTDLQSLSSGKPRERERAAAEREDERVRPSTHRPWAYSLFAHTRGTRTNPHPPPPPLMSTILRTAGSMSFGAIRRVQNHETYVE